MIAILTKYLGPTNTRGSRIKAYTENGQKITISYDYALSGEDLHKKAALALCKKMDWSEDIIGGGIRGGYVFVFIPSELRKERS